MGMGSEVHRRFSIIELWIKLIQVIKGRGKLVLGVGKCCFPYKQPVGEVVFLFSWLNVPQNTAGSFPSNALARLKA